MFFPHFGFECSAQIHLGTRSAQKRQRYGGENITAKASQSFGFCVNCLRGFGLGIIYVYFQGKSRLAAFACATVPKLA